MRHISAILRAGSFRYLRAGSFRYPRARAGAVTEP